MENNRKDNKIEEQTRSMLVDFYQTVKKGNQILSAEELEIAIESLRLAQKSINLTRRTPREETKKSPPSIMPLSATPPTEEKPIDNAVQLPAFEWFVVMHNGKPTSNVFTGSCRKDPQKGCLSTTTLNYKVYVENVGNDEAKFVVRCFKQLPWPKTRVKEDLSKREYPHSPKGLEEAKKRLNAERQKLMEDY